MHFTTHEAEDLEACCSECIVRSVLFPLTIKSAIDYLVTILISSLGIDPACSQEPLDP